MTTTLTEPTAAAPAGEGAAPTAGEHGKLFDPAITAAGHRDSFVKLNPRDAWSRNPVMFVVEVGSRAHHDPVLPGPRLGDGQRERVRRARRRCGCGSPCCSPTSPRRWPRGGARRRPTRCARPAPRRWRTVPPARRQRSSRGRRPQLAARRPVRRRRRRGDPRRRRRRRGHRHGRRVGDHRRVGAGHPRVAAATARPSPAAPGCSPTRSSCASRSKPGETFLDRMIALVEGADRQKTPERDRPQHPARRPHDHLPARRRDAAAVRHLLGRRAVDHRARRPARVPHPDDDRRRCSRRSASPAWTGSCSATCWPCAGRAVEAAGDVHHAAARQDRHDHLRHPPGGRVRPGPRRRRARRWPRRRCCRASPTRRPKGRSIVDVRRASAYGLVAAATRPSAVLVPFTAQTRMSGRGLRRRPLGPQGRRRLGAPLVAEEGGAVPIELAPIVDGIARDGGTPLVVMRSHGTASRRACSASSTSRTS